MFRPTVTAGVSTQGRTRHVSRPSVSDLRWTDFRFWLGGWQVPRNIALHEQRVWGIRGSTRGPAVRDGSVVLDGMMNISCDSAHNLMSLSRKVRHVVGVLPSVV